MVQINASTARVIAQKVIAAISGLIDKSLLVETDTANCIGPVTIGYKLEYGCGDISNELFDKGIKAASENIYKDIMSVMTKSNSSWFFFSKLDSNTPVKAHYVSCSDDINLSCIVIFDASQNIYIYCIGVIVNFLPATSLDKGTA